MSVSVHFNMRVGGLTPAQADKLQPTLEKLARQLGGTTLSRVEHEEHDSYATFLRRKKLV